MSKIIEYIGQEGIISTEHDWNRQGKPRVGDRVAWPQFKNAGLICAIDNENKTAHVCVNNGSAFLGINPDYLSTGKLSHLKSKIYISCSGGPFFDIPLSELEPTIALVNTRFWNWGDNFPGGGQGVHFSISRPVFNYIGDAEKIWGGNND
jgi:hypothetical protein